MVTAVRMVQARSAKAHNAATFLWNSNGGTEICDDGTQNGRPNTCNLSCTGITSAVCGNGSIESGETCDDGNRNNSDRCPDGANGTCVLARCGDGLLWNTNGGTETCDEGSTLNGIPNHCNATCTGITQPVCGNAILEQGENCDDGNRNNGDSCPDGVGGSCKQATCGDGYLWNTDGGSESCDDGTRNGTPNKCNLICSG